MPSSSCLGRPAGKHTGRLIAMAGVIALGIDAGSGPGLAQTKTLNHVVNLVGKQCMLTQKIGKESLLVALGIDREENLRGLEESRALFDRTLKGLRNGDTGLGLPAATEPEVLNHLGKVEELWPLLDSVVRNSIADQNVTAEDVDTIVELNMPLLQAADDTVEAYEREARDGNVSLISTLTVALNVSGRQRMLSQKMFKEYLLIAYGYEQRSNRRNLRGTIELFDRTLQELIEGDNDQGLLRAPTSEIEIRWRVVEQLWDEIRPQLEPFAKAGRPEPGAIANAAQANRLLLEELDKAVILYERL